MMGKLVLTQRPGLQAPYMLAGFGGWPNGGEVSTDTVEFLHTSLTAEPVGEITSDNFYVYSSPSLASRPITVVRHGVLRSLRFPTNRLSVWRRPTDTGHDLLLLQGVEPDLHWEEFAAAVLECIEFFQVSRLYTLGGYLDHAPHTRIPRVSAVVTHPDLRAALSSYDVDMGDYEGPTSIQSYLLAHCQERGVEGISLWSGTPSYIQGGYPRATHAMLRVLQRMWELPLDLHSIEEQAMELEATLHEQIDSNPELAEYIQRLEHAYDLDEPQDSELDAETIVDEIQQFLRRRHDGSDDDEVS